MLQFGDEFRPCKLTKHVYGFLRNNSNSFQFDRTLDSKLFGIIQKHSHGKPTLIFCATRKGEVSATVLALVLNQDEGVVNTAERIVGDYKEAQKKNGLLPWRPSR
jgi:ATP-dependent DNA helicase HFM1/MER3